MTNIFFLMQQLQVEKYVETKESIIQARNGMNQKEIQDTVNAVYKECNIYDIDTELEVNGGKLYTVENGVANIHIAGMLVQKVDFCSAFFGETVTTYKYLREASLMADNDPLVSKVLYTADSGGGYVSGCEETFQVMKNMNKPTYTAVKNMSASACYWLASATDEIIGISKTGFYGSIGVAVEIIDRSKADEEEGYKRIVFTNDTSKGKRPDLLTEEGQQILTKELNDIFNVFVDSILNKRADKLTREQIEGLNGQVYIASDAIEIGLIDKIMTEAELMEYLGGDLNINNPSSQGVKIIKREANKMTLAELLKENPEAQKEHDSLIAQTKEDATKAERERGESLLSVAGAGVPKELKDAFASGMSKGDYAIAELERVNEAKKNASDSDLGKLVTGNQTPTDEELKGKGKTTDENINSSVDEYLKKGAK